MRIGIIAEGHSDIPVIRSILKGVAGIEGNQIIPLMPRDVFDETQIAQMGIDFTHGTWSLVKRVCIEKKSIEEFLDGLAGEALVVIHLDTDVVEEPNFCGSRPAKNKDDLVDYSIRLREQVVLAIDSWLGDSYKTRALHAVAIEAIEAWLLPLHVPVLRKDTSGILKPKDKLLDILSKNQKSRNRRLIPYDYVDLSKDLRAKKSLALARSKSKSLDLFCEELEQIVN